MIPRAAGFCAGFALLLAGAVAAVEDPLTALPRLAKPRPVNIAPQAPGDQLAPGINVVPGKSLRLDGHINLDLGPADGLEVLACLRDGKTHESLIRLTAPSGVTVKAGVLAALGLADGQGASEGTGLPARGTPVSLTVEWQGDEGRMSVPASCLVRDRLTDQPFPPLPWIYTGSRFDTIRFAAPDGSIQVRDQFMLDTGRSIAVNYDEPDALIGSPFPCAGSDRRFEVNSAICPHQGTPVVLVISSAELPLTLDVDGAGNLIHAGTSIDDAALSALLTRHFGAGAVPNLRAVALRVERSVPRAADGKVRSRFLAAAAAAGAWVVPVFVPR